jgi:hypothetical protein
LEDRLYKDARLPGLYLRNLLWGGGRPTPGNPKATTARTGDWAKSFALPAPLHHDDIFSNRRDWAPVAMMTAFLAKCLDYDYYPLPKQSGEALVLRRNNSPGIYWLLLLVWRPPPNVDTTQTSKFAEALRVFLADLPPRVRSVRIVIAAEVPVRLEDIRVSPRTSGAEPEEKLLLRHPFRPRQVHPLMWEIRRASQGYRLKRRHDPLDDDLIDLRFIPRAEVVSQMDFATNAAAAGRALRSNHCL